MKRKEILLKMKAQINELIKLKKEYTYHESINFVLKELKRVYNCIQTGGTLSDKVLEELETIAIKYKL